MEKSSPVKMGLLLLGSFCIAHAAFTLIHELCHTGAAILTGGHSSGISLHPFSYSYSYSNSIHHPLIHISAGVLGSSLIALVLFILLIRRPKPVLLPLLLVGPLSLIGNGAYWVKDIITGGGHDACHLAQGGVSPWLLLFAGVAFCLIGIIMAIHLMRVIGLTNESFKNRLIILSIGLGSYAAVGMIWNWYSGGEILWYSGIVFLFVFSVISGFFKTHESKQYEANWMVVISLVVFGIGIVIILLLIAASEKSTTSSSPFKTFTVRQENFPDVLVPHKLAFDISYKIPSSISSKKVCLLNYSLPEDSDPCEVRNDLTKFIKDKGYTQLHYRLNNPRKPLNGEWREDTDKIGFKTIRGKAYQQEWIRLTPTVERLIINVHYHWRGDAFQTAGGFMIASETSKIDEVLWYADMHPEGFDWFEVSQLRIKALFGFNLSQPPVIMGQ